jgi:PAS domain-containing protein
VTGASARPLQLILARNLLSSLSTPAFLVTAIGDMVFYNEAAGGMLGSRFEETGAMAAADWSTTFGPFGEDGVPIPWEELSLTIALRGNQAAHGGFRIRSAAGMEHRVEASALPLVGDADLHGAIVIFWPVAGEEAAA